MHTTTSLPINSEAAETSNTSTVVVASEATDGASANAGIAPTREPTPLTPEEELELAELDRRYPDPLEVAMRARKQYYPEAENFRSRNRGTYKP